jgi:hypothetical protein
MDENEETKKALLELLKFITRKDIKVDGLIVTMKFKPEKPDKAKSKE